jgi:flagellar motor switch protein FliN/FliY
LKQLGDATVGVRLTAPWSAVGDEVVNRIGDLLGVRLSIGDTAQSVGTWPEFKASLPEHALGIEAQLQGSIIGRLGLLWAVEDVGTPIVWTDQENIHMELGHAAFAGALDGLSAAMGQKWDLRPTTEPVAVASRDTLALGTDESGVIITWEATGDDVTFLFALVMPKNLMQQLTQYALDAQSSLAGQSDGVHPSPKVPTRPPRLPQLQQSRQVKQHDLDLIMDLPLKLTVEIGSARMLIKDVLALGKGTVVELDKPAGNLVDMRVNDRLLARGEVVVLPDGKFGVRVMEIINSKERMQNLQGAK